MITIVPSGGTATQEHLTIEATMTNTLEVPIWAGALVATGCTVERTQPELPLLLEPRASVKVHVSLRCPEGETRWKLHVVEGLPQPSTKTVLPQAEETYDDLLLRVAQRVPAFGGMFFGFEGRQYTGVLHVYLVDPSRKEAAIQAIVDVFGPLYPDLLPPREVRMLPAQYSFLQLKEWLDRMNILHNLPEVTLS
ncbi:MAG: hypothetical protein QXD59_06560, partial [Candidatus Caldarchaeum sp.]